MRESFELAVREVAFGRVPARLAADRDAEGPEGAVVAGWRREMKLGEGTPSGAARKRTSETKFVSSPWSSKDSVAEIILPRPVKWARAVRRAAR